jgi:hypothetical protein
VARARAGTDIVLIAVDVNGDDCADADGDTGLCEYDVTSSTSNPSMIYFGGLASARVYRDQGGTPVWKANHVVTATLLDDNDNELFQVGAHKTNTSGNTTVWVVTGDSDTGTYDDHIIRAFGAAGQNETYPDDYIDSTLASAWYPADGEYTIGSHLDLLLEPAPVTFSTPTDCADMATNASLDGNRQTTTGGKTVYRFDDTPLTIAADLTLDGCGFEMQGGLLKVQSSATSSPVIAINAGGWLEANDQGTSGNPATIKAVSSTYGIHFDIGDGGTLDLNTGIL